MLTKGMFTDDDLRKKLRGEINGAKSLRQWALAKGISAAFVSDVLNGKRSPGAKLGKILGYKGVKVFTKTWTKQK